MTVCTFSGGPRRSATNDPHSTPAEGVPLPPPPPDTGDEGRGSPS